MRAWRISVARIVLGSYNGDEMDPAAVHWSAVELFDCSYIYMVQYSEWLNDKHGLVQCLASDVDTEDTNFLDLFTTQVIKMQ